MHNQNIQISAHVTERLEEELMIWVVFTGKAQFEQHSPTVDPVYVK